MRQGSAWLGAAGLGEARQGVNDQTREIVMNEKYFNLKEGMPTKPDVDELLKKHPDIKPGWRIGRSDLAGSIGQTYGTPRWNSIVRALKTRIGEEKGMVLLYDKSSKEYFIAKAKDTIALTSGVLKSASRKLRVQRKNLVNTKITATDEERNVLDHQCQLIYVLERETTKQNKNLLPDSSVGNQIKIFPPSKA